MINVERKRTFAVPAERIRAVLADVEQMNRLMPRAERVEVLARNENRARLQLLFRIGKLPLQRIEGEARLLDDGVRFVAVHPFQIDARYQVLARGESSEVTARLGTEIPRALASFARFIPQRRIEERIGVELDAALDALQAVLDADAPPTEREQHAPPPTERDQRVPPREPLF
jgi:carbon monoxide dehydrogenase subunit G